MPRHRSSKRRSSKRRSMRFKFKSRADFENAVRMAERDLEDARGDLNAAIENRANSDNNDYNNLQEAYAEEVAYNAVHDAEERLADAKKALRNFDRAAGAAGSSQ